MHCENHMMKTTGRKKILIAVLLLLMFCAGFLCTGCVKHKESFAASVWLSGGSGKASIESPCTVTVTNGKAYADLTWSSPFYDYMVVDGQVYRPVNSEGNSEFMIPIRLDEEMAVQADTTAMSRPHLIDYTLLISRIDDAADIEEDVLDDTATLFADTKSADVTKPPVIEGLSFLSTDENEYAKEFAIHRYDGGYTVLSVSDGRNYLIVPDETTDNAGTGDNSFDRLQEQALAGRPDNLVILKRPKNIYLAASAVMSRFDTLRCTHLIALSSLKQEDWYIQNARNAMEAGDILYGGKYSAPDYEMILQKEVDLAIESTMILHTPKVMEKLEQLGIPVLIDRSSYEEDPLGRLEWIKVYGLLTGKEAEAENAFLEQEKQMDDLLMESNGKTVVIFAVNSNHQIQTRRQNDYISRMVAKAGGHYLAPDGSNDNTDPKSKGTSQLTISLEAFYDYAKDADILIYNATIEEAPKDIVALTEKDILFKDFKAVKDGTVWVMEPSFYQYSDRTGTIIRELNTVIANGEGTTFFTKLR